jgi:3-oxoacyl-[acyl-carrier-protein] synthase III
VDEIHLYVFTQLNLRTIEFMMDNLGQLLNKTHWIMDEWGYPDSACIPAALDDALERVMVNCGINQTTSLPRKSQSLPHFWQKCRYRRKDKR